MAQQKWTTVVKSSNNTFNMDLKGLKNCKDLIFLFVRRTFVAKYKQTILGPAWAVIQPFFTTVVYSVFFGNIAGLGASGVPNFIFYLSGTIVWTLFANCLTETSHTFTGNSAILGKVYFPRLVMPISTAISQFIGFFIQFAFMLCFMAYYLITDAGLEPNIYILMFPLVLIQLAILGMGFGMIISALTTKYRDLAMVVSFGVSLWSYCSPVAYDMFSRSQLAKGNVFSITLFDMPIDISIYPIYMLNPVTPAINLFRYGFLGTGDIDWVFYGISWITTVAVAVIGAMMFSKSEKTFMDTV
ncbi:MAG: ABC transporter permease [Acutalibacteraceae bacterium]|nr:ABC transporter permease [Acutalibacteraceae bacterium]